MWDCVRFIIYMCSRLLIGSRFSGLLMGSCFNGKNHTKFASDHNIFDWRKKLTVTVWAKSEIITEMQLSQSISIIKNRPSSRGSYETLKITNIFDKNTNPPGKLNGLFYNNQETSRWDIFEGIAIFILQNLGFVINKGNSWIEARKVMEFPGFSINSDLTTIYLPK